jgi:hypothetical protein
MKFSFRRLLVAASLCASTGVVWALPCPPGHPPSNCDAPPNAILDLDGTPIPHDYLQYFTGFVAQQTETNISFALRSDFGFIYLDDISVSTGGGPNLLTNPGFEDRQAGWTYVDRFGDLPAGVFSGERGHTGPGAFIAGAFQTYEWITQPITTIPGESYEFSFWVMGGGTHPTFSRLKTNGDVLSNAIDLLAYAGAVPAIPEPNMAVLLLAGLGGALAWRRRSVRASAGAVA